MFLLSLHHLNRVTTELSSVTPSKLGWKFPPKVNICKLLSTVKASRRLEELPMIQRPPNGAAIPQIHRPESQRARAPMLGCAARFKTNMHNNLKQKGKGSKAAWVRDFRD